MVPSPVIMVTPSTVIRVPPYPVVNCTIFNAPPLDDCGLDFLLTPVEKITKYVEPHPYDEGIERRQS